MSAQPNALKVTNFSSLSRLEDIFGSWLVDVAYIADTDGSIAIVKPDDPSAFSDGRDPEWLQRVVSTTLISNGEKTAVVEIWHSADT